MISFDDQRALEELHNRYLHATDRRDYAQLRALFTHDAIDNHGEYNGPVDGYIDWLRAAQDYFESSAHIMSNLLFTVDGDRAESEGRGRAYLRLKGDKPFNMIVVSRHFDQYRKVEGRWLFSRRALCVDWVQQFEPTEGGLDMVQAVQAGRMGADDPVYKEAPQLIAALRAGLPMR